MMRNPSPVLELRPIPPVGMRGARVPLFGLKRYSDRVLLRIDPAAGTATWTGEMRRRGTVVMRLPDRAEPADLPELHTICVQTTRMVVGPMPRRSLVLADRSGRTIARSHPWSFPVFDALWLPGQLAPVTHYGIALTHETFVTEHKLNTRFPGAAPRWYVTSPPYNIICMLLTLAVLVTIFVLLIGYGVIGS